MSPHPPSRRALLGALGGLAAAAGIGVPLGSGLRVSGLRGRSSTGALLHSAAPLPEPFTRPLTVPAVLAPARTDATTDHYEIVQRPVEAELLPGLRTPLWSYHGTVPGPTIVSRSGRRTVVRHRNELPVPVVVHLHGGRTPPESDGYPLDLVLPVGHPAHASPVTHPGGDVAHGERAYVYPLDQRAATLWYHDHRMDFTGPAVWRGLAGFHLVRDDEEDALGLPAGEREIPLMVTDRSFAADGSLLYPSLDPSLTGTPGVTDEFMAGVLGDVILVNGVPWPEAELPAARHRFRILNACNARRLRLALDPPPPGGGGLVQIGSDGGLLDRPVPHDAVDLAPAERFDVVVDLGRYRPGDTVTLVNRFGSGGTRYVMRVRVGPATRDDSRVPARLSEVEPLGRARVAVRRRFDFGTGGIDGRAGWLVDGRPFDPSRADVSPRLGDVEVWRLRSDVHHPVHVHLAHVQVLARDGGPPRRTDAGWKDTVDLRPNEVAEVAVRFTGYRGRYVFHCHNLEHEDMAMMANVVTW